MEKTYQPHAIEQHWYHIWEQNHYFSPQQPGQSYTIVVPPPNITGSLHMGHGFQATIMDILIRYHRMRGDNTLWQPGTDHAGIATQMVVEKRLMLEGKSRHDLGREAFIKKVWEWKEQSGGTITQQFRRLGASLDWSRERFTMDDSMSYAVREVFIQLYNEGLIYRSTRLVNWDPVLLTAISDLEVMSEEEEGTLWHIRYPLVEGPGHVTIATTRPETLLGDMAVAVHPEDERYQHLIGKHVHLPLTERTVPIIADDYVDPAFGSGAVKITPAHDFNDYAVGQRHQLPLMNIFTPEAHLNENAPKAYQGLDRFAARKKIIQELEFVGVLEKAEKHRLKVPRGEKSAAVIEPYLTQQWFMKMKPLAAPAIDAVEQGKIKFIPENWTKTYFQWLNNIEDWCISRQLWWGHRIPVWQNEQGDYYVGHDEADVRQRYGLNADIKLTQDSSVLDTWFSSALWPFSTLGWPKKTAELAMFYPTQVLVTGFDIIFFWVARMIMMGLKFTGEVPFKEVFMTGLVRDAEGHKMSKSKGNVLDPIDLIDGIDLKTLIEKRTYGLMQPSMAQKIEKSTRQHFPEGIAAFGTDALRFTFCALASYGREIRFDIKRLEGYRNFCNKLWNAARFVLMNVEGKELCAFAELPAIQLPINRWILSRLQQTIQLAHEALQQYRFDLLAQTLYEFTWNEFCDWYVELVKTVLTDEGRAPAEALETRVVLTVVLETILRLLHPIMPFITEEIWQRIAPLVSSKTKDSIMLQTYPEKDDRLLDATVDAEIAWAKQFIIAVRTVRSEMNIAPNKFLTVLLKNGSAEIKKRLENYQALITVLAKLEKVAWLAEHDAVPECATTLVGELEILIPLGDVIDKKEEAARLEREVGKLQKEIARAEAKLDNPQFSEKAPAEVVLKEREKLAELRAALGILRKE